MSTVTEDSLLLTADEVQIEPSAAPASTKVTIVASAGGVMNLPGRGPVARGDSWAGSWESSSMRNSTSGLYR
jgi:hypothetical protein